MAKNGFKVLDSDMHCMEPPDLWERYIDPPFKHRAPKGSRQQMFDARYVIEGKTMPALSGAISGTTARGIGTPEQEQRQERVRGASERGWPPEAQLEAMDAEGIDVAVIYPTVGLFALALDDVEPDFAAAIARAYNNWLYDYCKADPSRLLGSAMAAPHDVESAVIEARRAVKDLEFRAVFMRPNPVGGRNWHDPYYDPLSSELEELRVPLGFHEGVGSLLPQVGDRFGANLFLRHVACHPMEMMLAVLSMCGGGALERHPDQKVAFLEGNCGWLPWLLDRMDDHYEIEFGITAADLPQEPSHCFKRQCFVSVESDERFVKQVIDYIGDDHIVFSTDWPHPDSKYPHSVETFLENKISEESKRKLLWDNCARYYGFQT
ncbi:MAG: amidohydrolase [Chloroflexi bacterium]|nr:amidohydrolase [Chloroflexota bacterium]